VGRVNRLKDSTSPYLLQHADNPVDWWPWCKEAFAEARRRDVPVLLSVGYSACHWCHVMAHQSFEDPQTAALMNENLVAVKVDREERPDIDAVYMSATQAMTGQGGWPMTVFMTPEGEPFFCGTYFPRDQFQRLVTAVARAWREDRENITDQGQRIAAALAERASAPFARQGAQAANAGPLARQLVPALAAAVAGLGSDFDDARGGFGGAPKFPPSMVLEFLLRHHERVGTGGGEPDVPGGSSGAAALRMAEATAEAMARGGMYDQLGGGFARYSVDAGWVVPHFEKMLYDNALLARVYAHLWRRTGSELARRVAAQTCDWMVRELRTPQGGFASALDADSEGEEGRFYVWTPGQLAGVLGRDDAEFAARAFGVTAEGTFEHGSSVLQLRKESTANAQDTERLRAIRSALFTARSARIPPGRDDKVVAAWNGLAVAALAETGLLLDRPDLVAAAEGAARLLAGLHMNVTAPGQPGRPGDEFARIARTSRDGAAGPGNGVLDDYACTAEGFLALASVTGEARWVRLAGDLLNTVLRRFTDGNGGFFDTADDAERLLYRPQDPADNATPSGWFAAAGALLSYGALTGSERHTQAASDALSLVPALARRFPRAVGWGMAVAEAYLSGPVEIAIVGAPADPRTAALHAAALRAAPPGAVIAVGPPDGAADQAPIPLLAGRGLAAGAPAAYVCRDFTCRAPVTTPEELRSALDTAVA
jgi:uncharacterized protein